MIKLFDGAVNGIFDTHAHIYDGMYGENGISYEELISGISAAGVSRVMIPADSVESSYEVCEFVKKYSGFAGVKMYAAVGVHPEAASDFNEKSLLALRELLSKKQEYGIAAVGEIGMDYHYDDLPDAVSHEKQEEAFVSQVKLAFEYDLPFILHERDASGDTLRILKDLKAQGFLRKVPGVCHCCSCSVEIAAELLKLGFYIGVDGPLTYKNNKKTPALCGMVPDDRLVVETDSPYLTPVPNRGHINTPAYLPFVLQKAAEIRGMDIQSITDMTAENGKKLFGIED